MDFKTITMLLILVCGALAASDVGTSAIAAGDKVWVNDMLYHGAYPTTYPNLIQPGDEGVWIDVEMRNYHSMPYYDRSEERRVGKECRSRWSP